MTGLRLIIGDGDDTAWMKHGACRTVADRDIFFPDRGQSGREAKSCCAGCPVRDQCLAYALQNRILHGVWGGANERERRRMLKLRNRGAA